MIRRFLLLIVLFSAITNLVSAQATKPAKRILIDVSHGQRFYNDPSDMQGKSPDFVERVRYMTGELSKNVAAFGGETSFIKSAITSDLLKDCDLLFIHMPSVKYSSDEVVAIRKYLDNGGSLFLAMDVDYWSTLEQVNANDLLQPYKIVFKSDNPDNQSSGGHSMPGAVTSKKWSVPYHGARLLEGGTPFAFSNQSEDTFGVYKEVGKGGRLIVMGDGMVSLYMTSWEGVNGYQCSQFMGEVLGWLLKGLPLKQ